MTELEAMIALDFSQEPTIVILNIIRTKMMEQFGPGGTYNSIALIPEYLVDEFLAIAPIRLSELPRNAPEWVSLHDILDAYVMCVGKTVAVLQVTLPTQSIDQIIARLAPKMKIDPLSFR
jgi:hypothetical protein